MTGVGGRPELVIEGADNEEGPWKVHVFGCHGYRFDYIQRNTSSCINLDMSTSPSYL